MDNYSESSESDIHNLIESPSIIIQDDENIISDDFVLPSQIDFDFLHDQHHLRENEEHEDNLLNVRDWLSRSVSCN